MTQLQPGTQQRTGGKGHGWRDTGREKGEENKGGKKKDAAFVKLPHLITHTLRCTAEKNL